MAQLPNYASLGFREIRVCLEDSVLVITIDRAKSRNTFTEQLLEELLKVFEFGDRDDRVRVIILTADHSAPAFCSGAEISGGWDVLWKEEETKEGPHAHRDGGGILSLAIYRCRKVTISAVNGHAAGIGLTALQLPFDIRIAWAGAKLTFPFVRRGIVPEATSSYHLPRLLGHSRASSLLLTGSTYSPNSPQIQSLYHEILPSREEVFPKALELARELAANTSQTSVAYTKALLQHPGDSAEETHLLDSRAMKILASSSDASEGVKAFFERRLPHFQDALSKDKSAWYPWWRTIDVKHRKAKL
ncbi:enoyl- hydratase isomerase family protein [Moniliophthora roreri MCA 2997]|uniref:Enoyl-hydratase isomerase family protein n=1 Tax=Moniliophthora roreri (strain MCA 2997) TaxID=1381753 RepID=V2XGD2_MONRO|nr:enoyl- hydratase isomerase family protein [Moniliophthora roreri MCA 2997]